jgi:hypothetical protein
MVAEEAPCVVAEEAVGMEEEVAWVVAVGVVAEEAAWVVAEEVVVTGSRIRCAMRFLCKKIEWRRAGSWA